MQTFKNFMQTKTKKLLTTRNLLRLCFQIDTSDLNTNLGHKPFNQTSKPWTKHYDTQIQSPNQSRRRRYIMFMLENFMRKVQQSWWIFQQMLKHDSNILDSNMPTQTNLHPSNSSLQIRSDIKLNGQNLVKQMQERKQQKVRPNAAAFVSLILA